MTAAIQSSLQTLLQALATFDDDDVSLGDYLILDRGSAPYAVILPGPFTATEQTFGGVVAYEWLIPVDVVATFLDDDYSQLNTTREAVINQVNANPTLGNPGTYYDAIVASGGEIFYIYPQGNREHPQFVAQRLNVQVKSEGDYSATGEFA